MKMRKDIMVDIETLGRKEGSTIFQIAAMSFDITTGETFDEIDLILDLSKVDILKADGDTIKWWLIENKELLARTLKAGKLSEVEMAEQFYLWLVEQAGVGNEVYLWGNGILFDNNKLQHFLNSPFPTSKVNIHYPIYYRNDRDVRTILELASLKTGIPERQLIKSVERLDEELHDALDDTRKQIRLVHKCYQFLMMNKPRSLLNE